MDYHRLPMEAEAVVKGRWLGAGVENIERKKGGRAGLSQGLPPTIPQTPIHSMHNLDFSSAATAQYGKKYGKKYGWKEAERKLSPMGDGISQHSQYLQYFFVGLLLC